MKSIGLKIRSSINLFLLLILLGSCAGADDPRPEWCLSSPPGTRQILFLGHTYQWRTTNRIDERLERLKKDCYDEVWLGGDICAETTRDTATLDYLDSIFGLSSPKVHWTLGNHDIRNGNLDMITRATGRNSFYSHFTEGLTLMVMNSVQDFIHKEDTEAYCRESRAQFDLMKQVCDTISSRSSHLVVLMHFVLWGEIHKYHWTYANAGRLEWKAWCDSTATFKDAVYPMLKAVQDRGIQVICIAGDIGLGDRGDKTKIANYRSPEAIWFIGSGINNSAKRENYSYWTREWPDRLLVLDHNPEKRSLTWRFPDLDSLLWEQDCLLMEQAK